MSGRRTRPPRGGSSSCRCRSRRAYRALRLPKSDAKGPRRCDPTNLWLSLTSRHHASIDEEPVTISIRSPEFQRAFLALRYFWGARGEALSAPLGELSEGARKLLAGLDDPERSRRASTLSRELGRLAAA